MNTDRSKIALALAKAAIAASANALRVASVPATEENLT
jgi:hypothetical protein